MGVYRTGFKYARKGIRAVGRGVRYAAKYAKKRYFKGKSYRKPRLGKIAGDVYAMSRVLNAEKKQFSANYTASIGSPTAQTMFQLVTNISEGTTRTTRLGESCKIVSWVLEYQFAQQASTVNKRYCKLWFIQFRNDSTATTTISNFLDNDMNGNAGYSSIRNPDYYRQFRVLGSKKIYLDCDQTSSELVQRQGRIYGKTNMHQRYSSTTAASLIWGPLYIVAVVNAGNTTSSTGVDVSCRLNLFFYDN